MSSASASAATTKQRRDVLSEEEYQSTLTAIVQRDYFPGLLDLQKEAGVLNCREHKDFKGAVAVRRAARRLADHEAILAADEAEQEQALLSSLIRREPRPLHRETVTGFHARVISEDNQEFDSNLARETKERLSRIEAVYQNKLMLTKEGYLSNNEIQRIGNESPLALASDQFNPPSYSIKAHKNSKQDNGFFFPPQLTEQQHDHKSTEESNGTKPLLIGDTDLMPPPAQVIAKKDLVEYIPKHVLEKRIEPSQTRFPTSGPTTAVLRRIPKRAADDVSSTTDYSSETTTTTDLDEPMSRPMIQLERNARAKRQCRELETLVAMTPLITPNHGNSSPITTWGTVSSTPMVLGRDTETAQTAAAAFLLPNTASQRELAAQAAEETLAQRRRAQSSTPSISSSRTNKGSISHRRHRRNNTPTPLLNRMSNLTPAARALLQKSVPKSSAFSISSSSSTSARSSNAFSKALVKSYTPGRTGGTRSRSNMSSSAGAATPLQSFHKVASKKDRHSSTTINQQPKDGNLTSGLLNLPG